MNAFEWGISLRQTLGELQFRYDPKLQEEIEASQPLYLPFVPRGLPRFYKRKYATGNVLCTSRQQERAKSIKALEETVSGSQQSLDWVKSNGGLIQRKRSKNISQPKSVLKVSEHSLLNSACCKKRLRHILFGLKKQFCDSQQFKCMNSTSESSLNRYLTLGTPCNHGQYFPRLKTMKNSSSQDYEFASLLVKGHVTTYFKVGGHIHKDTMVKDKSSCELQKPMDKNKFGQAVETLHSNSCSDRTLKLSREQYVVLMKNRFSVEEPKNFDILYCMKADEDGDRPLHIATIHEDVSLVKHLCSLMKRIGASVHIYNYLQQTPLHLAIVVGNQHIVEILLEEGACPKSQDRYGNTSLHLAVKYNRLECLHILLKYKQVQDIRNLRNYDGYSALHLAVTNNSSTSIKYLVKACCDIDVKDGKSGRTPLFHAVMNNNKPLIKLLLKLGGSPDAPDFSGVSPLQASLLNNKDIALLMGSRKLRTYSKKISACGKENVIRKQRKIIK